MDKKKPWKRKILSTVLLLAASVIIGVTGATIIHMVSLENPIQTPDVTGEIDEKIGGHVKKAKFHNSGTADVFVRVAYSESWIYREKGKEDVVLPNYLDGIGKIAYPQWGEDSWTEGEDNWLYYNYPVKGKGDTEFLVTEVRFGKNKETSIPSDVIAKDSRYKDAEYQLHFVAEAVQCSNEKKVSRDAVVKVFSSIGNGLADNWPIEWTNDVWPVNDAQKYTTKISWPGTIVKNE